jgi:hypothetical protein
VRGKTIGFDRDAINTYLGNPYTFPDLEDDEEKLCPYQRRAAKGDWDHGKIQLEILKRGKKYDRSEAVIPHRAMYSNMTVPAQVIFKFIVHNVWPKSHTSSSTLKVTPLIWYILSGGEVDIARIIARELKKIVISGRNEPSCKLAFPGLIVRLVLNAKICIPPPVHEELKGPIDDAFIDNLEKKESRASTSRDPPPQVDPSQALAPTHQAFDFSSFVPW